MKAPHRLVGRSPAFAVAAAGSGAHEEAGEAAGDPRDVRTALAGAARAVDRSFDRVFGASANPLRQLGGLAFDLFWVIAATGAFLYVFYDTSADGAWVSVERMTSGAIAGGAFLRSLHRYASDALVVVVAAHLLREWAYGRHRGFRWFTWLTGVPTPWLILAAGGVGFWLLWDTVALFVAVAIAEWFGALPGFDPALARNFVDADAVSDRLFSLLLFLHIGVSLVLLLAMWLHVKRLTRPRSRASGAVRIGSIAALSVVSLFATAPLQPPADPSKIGGALPLDWFYLAPLAALEPMSPLGVWAAMIVGTLLVGAAPWLTRRARARAPAARVDADHCNGCQRCFADCPYSAIEMAAHPSGRGLVAVVDADRCASCGICAGACPSSMPFRSGDRLATGIDLPDLGVGLLRDELDAALATHGGASPIVAFGCRHAAPLAPASDCLPIALPCAAMLPPSFVEYALRQGARGVAVVACPPDDCEYRSGAQWMAQRLAGAREPRLRAGAERGRIRFVEAAREDLIALHAQLAHFRHDLDDLERTMPARAHVPDVPKESRDAAVR